MWSHKYCWCDIVNRVDVMTQLQWIRCQYSGCDVIKMVAWYHKVGMIYCAKDAIHYPSVMSYRVFVMTIEWEWWQRLMAWCHVYSVYVALYTGCGFIHRGCDIINTVVWWHKVLIWCYIKNICCHTYGWYHVIQKLVWYQWIGCDDKDRVGAVSDTVDVRSCLKWMWHHKYCDLVW